MVKNKGVGSILLELTPFIYKVCDVYFTTFL